MLMEAVPKFDGLIFLKKCAQKKFYFVHNLLHKLYYTHAYIKLHTEVQFFIV